MGICVNHPDRETSYLCSKYDIYLCEECLSCRDPDIYCKFRSSCPISFISKDNGKLDAVTVKKTSDDLPVQLVFLFGSSPNQLGERVPGVEDSRIQVFVFLESLNPSFRSSKTGILEEFFDIEFVDAFRENISYKDFTGSPSHDLGSLRLPGYLLSACFLLALSQFYLVAEIRYPCTEIGRAHV